MSTSRVTREAKYIYTDVRGNNNKFWNIQELADNSCYVHWGRVGGNGQTQTKQFTSSYQAARFFDSKCHEKEIKGYQKLKVLIEKESVVLKHNNRTLADLATRQIKTDAPQTIELVKRLATANIHNILAVTTLAYDTSKGTFSTPLGIVTQEAIEEARTALSKMVIFVKREDFHNRNYINLLNQYLRLVPQKVGRKIDPETLYPDLTAIEDQNDILDALEASLKVTVKSAKAGKQEEPKLFQARLRLVEDGRTIDRIQRLYQGTRQTSHVSNELEIKQIFEVEIKSMREAFEQTGREVGNVMELWHGTKIGNLLSILKNGFDIPPANSAHCTGRMFGNGVYFSDQSTKALNYSCGFWSGIKEQQSFMLLSDVAMGRYYVPPAPTQNLPKAGFSSTFAQAQKSGVMNNEMIVYNTNQINPKYLVEFEKKSLFKRLFG